VVSGNVSSPHKAGHQMDRDILEMDGINKHRGWFLNF
jgi:hypothetical protein